MRFKIDWVSLGFALLYLVFEGFSKYKPPRGLYLEGRFNGGLFASTVWGAYIWRGLFSEFYGTSKPTIKRVFNISLVSAVRDMKPFKLEK